MSKFDKKEFDNQKKLKGKVILEARLQTSDRCIASTVNGTRCENMIDGTPDDQLLCHIHHPERTFQKDLRERKQVFNQYKQTNLQLD